MRHLPGRIVTLKVLRWLDEAQWLVPGVFMLGAVALSFGAQAIDAQMDAHAPHFYLFQGGPAGATAVLTTISSSMMTFTGVVFSITILVLQLASNQFSPGLLRTFLRDKKSQTVLGIFIGTFIYALLTLRVVWVSSEDRAAQVPQLSVWVAVMLSLLCVSAFIFFIHHVSQAIRAVNVLIRIGDETRDQLAHLFPGEVGASDDHVVSLALTSSPTLVVVSGKRSGVINAVDEEALWAESCRANVVVVMLPTIGDFVATTRPLFEVYGDHARLDVALLCGAVSIGAERSITQDVAYGLRRIVDIAERALSPGINDPSTAVQAIDQLHDLLMRLARRQIPSTARADEDGVVRLVLPRPNWLAYVHLSVDEIRQCGAGSVQITRRLRFMLQDLLIVVPPFRRAPLLAQLALLDAGDRRSYPDLAELLWSTDGSPQGNGPSHAPSNEA